MKLEVLVSTMNLKNVEEGQKLRNKMNINTPSIIINQITDSSIKEFDDEKIFSKKEKGLSRSRNMAIEKASEEICVIADDDLVYVEEYEKIILNAYEEKKDADIIAFYVKSNTKNRPTTVQKEKKCGYLSSMRIASFQITFKRSSVINSKVKFDETFGAGSGNYLMGEENIFLFDCLRRGLKIYFVPIKIAEVTHLNSTWFNEYNETYFKSKGACFYRMSKLFSNVLIFQFAIRKRNLFKQKYNVISAIKIMLKGKKEYKNYVSGRTNG